MYGERQGRESIARAYCDVFVGTEPDIALKEALPFSNKRARLESSKEADEEHVSVEVLKCGFQRKVLYPSICSTEILV